MKKEPARIRNTDFNLQEKETPADGVITGYGVIDGNLVYVYSQDAAVLNGASLIKQCSNSSAR